jgi:signal transduction histidine kinase
VNLRTKLLLAQSPLVVALAICGVAGGLIATSLGRSSEHILQDNYRSVLAAQRMKDALDGMQAAATWALAGRRDPGGAGKTALDESRFEDELRVEQQNITEPGEAEAVQRLGDAWRYYLGVLQKFSTLRERSALEALYFDRMVPAYQQVKNEADSILAMNQDAMILKSGRTKEAAGTYTLVIALVALAGCLIGLWAARALTERLLRPLSILTQAAQRIGQGDLEVRAVVSGEDEIARLATEFNTMAEHLRKYRRSSLGELLEAQSASQAAIDSLPDPVVAYSVDGQLLHVNRAAEAVFGIRLEPGVRDALALVDPDLRTVLERLRAHVLEGKGAYVPKGLDEALRLPSAEGDRYFLPRASPIYAAEGNVSGTMLLFQDVTRLVRFEELKNDLVATVAHEFRTPLTSLRMAIHLCNEQVVGPLTEKQAELLHAAREDCDRLQTIVDELLDLSRIQSGHLVLRRVRVSAEALVSAALGAQESVALERGVQLRSEILPDAGDVSADIDRIQIVLGNLLSNSIRFSPPSGEVVARAFVDHGMRFEVSDEGPGIPHEYQQAIFEKYFQMPGTAAPGGAGLGLFIAREIVQAHGGQIGVESRPGKGSTFWFTLPLAA